MQKKHIPRLYLSLILVMASSAATAADLYDPAADPVADLQAALASAGNENNKVIVQVGGNWCRWTRALDNLYQSDAAISSLIRDHYELVRVNYSDENFNEQFISTLGETNGIPFIFILDKDGKVLHAQETGSLELGDGHDRDKVYNLYNQWK